MQTTTTTPPREAADRIRPLRVPLAAGVLVLLIACALSLMVGSNGTASPGQVVQALTGHADPQLTAAVQSLRLPRTVLALLIGAGLAVAGALIQGVTRNPIVEPSIIGVNAGAALAVALVTYTLGATAFRLGGISLMPFVAFAGAAAAAGLVFVIVAGVDMTPGRVALAGVTVALLANALVMSVVVLNDNAVQFLLRYLVGGVDGASWAGVRTLLPYSIIGLGCAFLLAKSVTVLSLGDDIARGLGLPVERVRLQALALVVVLAGAAVAVAGPIAMVGLLVPHMARWSVGTSYLRVFGFSIVYGGALLVTADVVSRIVVPSTEVPVGVLTAVLGTPYFIYLARRGRGVV
ncbi:FecCD family ABC transporter permease [Kribbella sp. NPDC050241]|uniref:FecCD family ABC transporter permease n=1 Tax=Kribbella sp. NPDC050241 TaxID=3364115 RepID=UPI0037A0BF2A